MEKLQDAHAENWTEHVQTEIRINPTVLSIFGRSDFQEPFGQSSAVNSAHEGNPDPKRHRKNSRALVFALVGLSKAPACRFHTGNKCLKRQHSWSRSKRLLAINYSNEQKD